MDLNANLEEQLKIARSLIMTSRRTDSMTEVVHIHTLAGTFHVNFSESFEQGLLGMDHEPESKTDAMRGVERACEQGFAVLDTGGNQMLISARCIVAMTYVEQED